MQRPSCIRHGLEAWLRGKRRSCFLRCGDNADLNKCLCARVCCDWWCPDSRVECFGIWWCQLVGNRAVLIEILQPHHSPDMDNQNENRADQVNTTLRKCQTRDTSDKVKVRILTFAVMFFFSGRSWRSLALPLHVCSGSLFKGSLTLLSLGTSVLGLHVCLHVRISHKILVRPERASGHGDPVSCRRGTAPLELDDRGHGLGHLPRRL